VVIRFVGGAVLSCRTRVQYLEQEWHGFAPGPLIGDRTIERRHE
jgi:hypothetical protein